MKQKQNTERKANKVNITLKWNDIYNRQRTKKANKYRRISFASNALTSMIFSVDFNLLIISSFIRFTRQYMHWKCDTISKTIIFVWIGHVFSRSVHLFQFTGSIIYCVQIAQSTHTLNISLQSLFFRLSPKYFQYFSQNALQSHRLYSQNFVATQVSYHFSNENRIFKIKKHTNLTQK